MHTATALAPELLPDGTRPQPATRPKLVNPYLACWVKECQLEVARMHKTGQAPSPEGSDTATRMMNTRRGLVKKYSFAIPTQEAISTICSYGPAIEIGAGTGYWAWLVRQLGGDILAFDIRPPKREACPTLNRFHGNEGCWTEVNQGTESVIPLHPERTLLLGWPPFGEPLALRALQLYRRDYFLYIGALPRANGWRGPMGSDAFLDELQLEWHLMKSVKLPNWDLCWDALHVFKRRTI